jgi:hypothetical protein
MEHLATRISAAQPAPRLDDFVRPLGIITQDGSSGLETLVRRWPPFPISRCQGIAEMITGMIKIETLIAQGSGLAQIRPVVRCSVS